MGKIKLVRIERRRALPTPEELVRRWGRATEWLRGRRINVYYHPAFEEEAQKIGRELQAVLKELGIKTKFSLVQAPDFPDQNHTTVHAWLGKKKRNDPEALHVAVGPFSARDTFFGVEYEALASASMGGLLAVRPEITRLPQDRRKALLVHEILHLFGLEHEHSSVLPIMNPIRPRWDEKSKRYAKNVLEKFKEVHGLLPWWKRFFRRR